MLQKALVAQDKKMLALEAAEEGRAKALHDLMVLCDDLEWETAETNVLTCSAMQELAAQQQSSIVVYSMVEPDQLLYVWVVPASGGEPIFTQVDLEALSTEHGCTVNGGVQKLYESMAALSSSMPCRGPAQAAEEGAPAAPAGDDIPELSFLYTALVAPVIELLPTDKDVVFVPHGVLNLVPFAALKNSSGESLVKSHAMSVSPSVRTFAALANRAATPVSDATLVVANPEILPQFELPSLPGCDEEAKAVAEAIGSDSTTILSGADARMQRVVQEMQNASMMHFACHGQPGILYLGPTLPSESPDSPVDEEEDEEEEQYDDGLLYREHLHYLHLPAKPSVVLSCNYSAAGSITEDGILGLPRGFLAAGARSVLSTLWVAPEESASSVMQKWHTEAKNAYTEGSQAKALQTAMLQTMSDPKFAHPLHWAGYVLFGNPSQYKAPLK